MKPDELRALDALQEETRNLTPQDVKDVQYFERVDDAITALRAEVELVEAERNNWRTRQQETQQFLDMIAKKAREARQVTREQLEEALVEFASACVAGNHLRYDPEAQDTFAAKINLEIVEEAPKLERRECPIKENAYGKKYRECQISKLARMPEWGCCRCTITEEDGDDLCGCVR